MKIDYWIGWNYKSRADEIVDLVLDEVNDMLKKNKIKINYQYNDDNKVHYIPLKEGETVLLKDFRLDGKQCVFDNPAAESYVLQGIPYDQQQPELTLKVYYPWFGEKRCHIQAW